jgi:ElaB/YqjD/DUF883 family membrane-anchored ribosome-binding protein
MSMAAVRKEALKKVNWEEGQDSAVRMWNQARENGEDLLYQLNRHVRRHPWKAVGVGLAVGALFGLVISSQSRR